MKWLPQIVTKSLCGAIPSMIMFFRLFFITLSCMVFIKCKMSAEIVENRWIWLSFFCVFIFNENNDWNSQYDGFTAHIIQFSMHLPDIVTILTYLMLFPCFSVFRGAVFWLFHAIHNGNRFDEFVENCPHLFGFGLTLSSF